MVAVIADVGEVVVGDEGQDEEGGEYHGDQNCLHVALLFGSVCFNCFTINLCISIQYELFSFFLLFFLRFPPISLRFTTFG